MGGGYEYGVWKARECIASELKSVEAGGWILDEEREDEILRERALHQNA